MKGNEGTNNNNEISDINKNQLGPSAPLTLKSKINSLEETIVEINKAISENITDIKELEKEKNEQQTVLKQKTDDMKKSLIVELNNVEVEMKKHLNVQKDENVRLQKLITQLKMK